jgi:CHAT domain-containing protein
MKEEPTIYLEVSASDNQIKIGLQRPQDMVWHYDTIPVSISDLNDCIQHLTENINLINRTEGQAHRASEKIKALGQRLCDTLLSPDIKNILRKSMAEYLILKLDDSLVSIPWELICLDNQLLSERFCMGRIVKTHQSVTQTESRSLSFPLEMWILTGDDPNLSGVEKETQQLLCEMDQLNKEQLIVSAAFDQGGSVDQIKSQIRNFDIIHFAGHSDYNLSEPDQSGWRFNDSHLTASDIDRMSGSATMPALIFSNACQSARTCQWSLQDNFTEKSFDLANAFIRSGVRHYLGTFWEIPDQAGSTFAINFYQALFESKSIGMALKHARMKCLESDGAPISAAYVLYGDPRQTYIDPSSSMNQTIQTRGAGFRPFRALSQKVQSIPLNGLWLFMCIAMIIVGVWIWHQALLRVDNFQQMDKQRILKKIADEKRDYIDQLFLEIEKITGQSAYPQALTNNDKWTSRRLTLSIDYETHLLRMEDRAQLSMLSAVVGKALIENHHATVLERVHLDKILQELKRANSGLINKHNRIRPDLLPSRLIVFIELHKEKNKTIAILHLADIEQGHVVDYFFMPLQEKSILQQQEHLSRSLIDTLRQHYPIRGKIERIQDQFVFLNIGSNEGVKKDQVFIVLKNHAKLNVTTCLLHTCTTSLKGPNIKLERGWKVEAVTSQ